MAKILHTGVDRYREWVKGMTSSIHAYDLCAPELMEPYFD
jgi:hypothetical protein